ncbi:MAG: winged helix-turn-helix transcriptional regulator [Candidatus Diapherotrites archaeon]|nr:winged helix-turn-helix transcriptional regulator [Candidatus Diapherotrites archaeon]
MARASFVIRLRKVERLSNPNFDNAIEYLCKSLCLEAYETDTAKQILLELLKSREGLSSTELSMRINKSRGAIINQLNRLINAGLIVRERRRYQLRASTLSNTIAEMQEDVERIMKNMLEIARMLDELT